MRKLLRTVFVLTLIGSGVLGATAWAKKPPPGGGGGGYGRNHVVVDARGRPAAHR